MVWMTAWDTEGAMKDATRDGREQLARLLARHAAGDWDPSEEERVVQALKRAAQVRGWGGFLVAGAAAIFAQHVGMSVWQVFAVFALVGLGLPMLVMGVFRVGRTGRG